MLYRYRSGRLRRTLVVIGVSVLLLAGLVTVLWAVLLRPSTPSAVAAEVRKNAEQLDRLERNLATALESLNELRTDLGFDRTALELPSSDETGDSDDAGGAMGAGEGTAEVVDLLLRLKDAGDRAAFLENEAGRAGFLRLVDELGLSLEPVRSDMYALSSDYGVVFEVAAVGPEELRITADDEEIGRYDSLDGGELRRASRDLNRALERHEEHVSTVEVVLQDLDQTPIDDAFVDTAGRGAFESHIEVKDSYGRVLAAAVVGVDTIRVDGSDVGLADGLAVVRRRMVTADTRSPEDLQRAEALEALREFVQNQELTAQFLDAGLIINERLREDSEYLYFDITDRSGRKVGALAAQLEYGTLWIVDADDVPIASLGALSDGDLDTDIIPGDSSIETPAGDLVALVGTHERLADTIVVAHADPEDKTISLLSVPRDLFFQGRKINSVFRAYGAEQFLKELSTIIGVRVDRYLAVDMYAFIDVVNILGGIDVYLAEDLVDPTYSVKDQGLWGTLAYEKGTHHLSGLEALRVARSRYVSSDFGRAERQHEILKGILDRIKTAGVAEVTRLAQVLIRFVETNIGLPDLVRLGLTYRRAELSNRYVLSSYNVLYATYTNLYYSNMTLEEVDDDFFVGSWILVPTENRWDRVQSYVRNALFGGKT